MGRIVWLASYPRSGNTWTRSFLHNLLDNKGEAKDINAVKELARWDISAELYRGLLPRPVAQCTKDEIAAARPKALARIAASAPGLVFVKTHNALVVDRGTHMIEPSVTAGAVYIVRNPLDVAVSYSHHETEPIDQVIRRINMPGAQNQNSERSVYQVMGSWSENVATWSSRPNRIVHVMRYEDMLDNPRIAFANLVEFLQIRCSKDELLKAIERSSFASLRKQEDAHGFFEKPAKAQRFFRKGTSNQWVGVLNDAQVTAIVAAHRRQMERFDYVPAKY